MARKKIGFYIDDFSNNSDHQLILEFGNDELVCIAKSAISGEIVAFELFSLDKGMNDDWNDIFYEIKALSQVFNFSYKKVTCFFNNEEALLIPEKLLTATSAEDYLSLVYGESTRHDVKYEKLLATKVFINAYRVRKAITELLSRHFIIYQTSHTYSTILNDVMRRPLIAPAFIKIQFYTNHFIIAVWKDERFQLIQSYRYQSDEDVLYYLMRITQQFNFELSQVSLEVSGFVDKELSLYSQLSALFNNISTDNMQPVGVFQKVEGEYPPHYFTPFYKLTL